MQNLDMKKSDEISTVNVFLSDPIIRALFDKEYAEFSKCEKALEELDKHKKRMRLLKFAGKINLEIDLNITRNR